MKKTCIVCGSAITESRLVCFRCEEHAERYGPPVGWMSACDVQDVTGLRGQQLMMLMKEYGVSIGKRQCIEVERFKLLYATGKLNKFRAYRMYAQRKSKGFKKAYEKRADKIRMIMSEGGIIQ